MIGNAVPPLMMRSVARWIIDAGFEPGEWGDWEPDGHNQETTGNPRGGSRPTVPKIVSDTRTDVIQALLVTQRILPAAGEGFGKWSRALLAASTVVRAGDKVNPHWALPTP